MPLVQTDDLLGVAEVGEMLDASSVKLHRWRTNGVILPDGRRVLFPRPVRVLRATPVWDRADIERVREALDAPAVIEHL